jgi:hypothetical protein
MLKPDFILPREDVGNGKIKLFYVQFMATLHSLPAGGHVACFSAI